MSLSSARRAFTFFRVVWLTMLYKHWWNVCITITGFKTTLTQTVYQLLQTFDQDLDILIDGDVTSVLNKIWIQRTD